MRYRLEWRGPFENGAVNELHAEAFAHEVLDDDWLTQVQEHSLGWVCAWRDRELIGFVNVPWDGACHAFVVDAMVRADVRGHGVGTAMVRLATEQARDAGCEWLHVDFDDELGAFYLGACGFVSAPAGVIKLRA